VLSTSSRCTEPESSNWLGKSENGWAQAADPQQPATSAHPIDQAAAEHRQAKFIPEGLEAVQETMG
jgi:hypothetical protein